MEIRWARAATRHRVSRERSRYVIEHCGLPFEWDPPVGSPLHDPRLLYLGDDAEGIALEVVAIELDDDALLVIHAMPLRNRFSELYEEARRWRR